MIHTNRELALKLETAEALNQVEGVRTHNRLIKDSQARYQKIGSGYAIYAGNDSPLTQIFGLGLSGEVSEEQIIELEEFYKQWNAPVQAEVCHLSDIALSRMFIERGYQISEFSNVLLRRLDEGDQFAVSEENQVRQVRPEEIDKVAEVISEGFLETKEIPPLFREIFRVCFAQSNATMFAAFKADPPAGGGTLFIMDDIALLGGASTLPAYRNQGIQTDLLRARLAYAQAMRCRWAMVTTQPGTISQKNVERQGFQVVYSRTKFTKEGSTDS
jgi:GNAT superfamily N-acetyltransferase